MDANNSRMKIFDAITAHVRRCACDDNGRASYELLVDGDADRVVTSFQFHINH
jgi:hypothetical protein